MFSSFKGLTFKRFLKKVFYPQAQQSEDGRDQWPNRTSYLLACLGGAVGFGNLLRYPSQVYNNNGIQWFIPYLLALVFLAIPVLILEVSIGQAHRGGSVTAYNALNKRTRGVGAGMLCVGAMVCLYYVPMLGWVLKFFRHSFRNPLPWAGQLDEFYRGTVTADVGPTGGAFTPDGSVVSWVNYVGRGINGESLGWTAFAWFTVWLCIYKGVATTGKVVYFTMGLPIVLAIVLVGRGTSLPNAGQGIKLYFGEFHASKLANGQIWQDALGQVFYSTGVGFGYYTAYASFNNKHANAVQDSIIICCGNSVFEVFIAFAVFGVVGFLDMTPDPENQVGSFTLGFLTLPEALAQMPAAQFWAILFFFTLFLLGMSSAFAMIDALITMICDSNFGRRFPRIAVSSTVIFTSFLTSIIYCTEFGYALLDAIDSACNNVTLIFVVWCECIASTVLYRSVDVLGQVGRSAFLVYNGGYFGGMIAGLAVAHSVSPAAGAGLGFGLYVVGAIASPLIARTPDSTPPRFWSNNAYLACLWWLAFYSGNQLRRDLNVTVATGKNWALPVFWPVILRYIAAPTLAIVFTFAYATFYPNRNDPLYIFAFGAAHLVIALVILAAVVPRFLEPLVPTDRVGEGDRSYAPQVIVRAEDVRLTEGMEAGSSGRGSSDGVAEKALPQASGGDDLPAYKR